jgi:hypothetical protein
MRTIETKLYQFDELSEQAREKALAWYRGASVGDNYFAESVYDDASEIAKILGVDFLDRKGKPRISWSGFWSQGGGASFEGNYRYAKGASKAIRAYAPFDDALHAIADNLQAIQRKHFYGLSASVSASGHRYSHEMTMRFDVSDRNGESAPESAEDVISEELRDFARWIYRQLEQAYQFENSDENVAETIRINEYEFEEDGARA